MCPYLYVLNLYCSDWMWPAIWMLPVKSTYGPWPASGEIDLMEARGNLPSYGAQGLNYVRSSLNYGPFEAIMTKIYGWQSQKRSSYDLGFHTYTMEWTDGWMRISVDSKIKATLDMTLTGKGGKSFWSVVHILVLFVETDSRFQGPRKVPSDSSEWQYGSCGQQHL